MYFFAHRFKRKSCNSRLNNMMKVIVTRSQNHHRTKPAPPSNYNSRPAGKKTTDPKNTSSSKPIPKGRIIVPVNTILTDKSNIHSYDT